MVAVLTVEDYLAAPGGVEVDGIPYAELDAMLSEALDLANSHVHNVFQYQSHAAESHLWPAISNTWFFTNYSPVRQISKMAIFTGMTPQQEIDWPIDLGFIRMDPGTNSGQASSIFLTMHIVPILAAYVEPELVFTYTSGYDDGTVQADGVRLPWPQWMVSATREIMRELVGEWWNANRGMTALQSVGVGPYHYARPARRNTKEETAIPRRAAIILEDNFRRVDGGVVAEGVGY